MSEQQMQVEMRLYEDKLKNRYSFFIKLFLLITFLLLFAIIIVFSGVAYFELGYNWAGLNLDSWNILASGFFVFFIILILFFYYHFSSIRNKIIELEKPKPEFLDGKMVHIFTYPKGKEGGLFSKTYIEIDEHNVLRLRTLMIPPEEVW
jgi:hypothetical protein